MAYFALFWKARTIEKYRLLYEKEKLNSIKISRNDNEVTTKSFFPKLRNRNFDVKKRLSNTFRKLSPEGSAIHNFCFYLKTDQTFPNFVLKSVLGFVGGIVLTYLCFMFFVFQLSISLVHATIMSSIIGLMLTLGLAFSYRIRCLVLLLIPQFFSRVGRYTLTCYALVLILTGPATNTLKNSEVLSESMACTQEQIRTNVNVINESMKKPFNSMKGTIKLLVDNIRQIARKLKEALVKFQRLVIIIAKILQSSFSWLDSVANTCNEKFGTPYELCTRSLNDAVADCHARLGPKYYWVCNTGQVADLVCWTLKPLKSFCHAIDFVERNILKSVRRKLRTFSERIKTMLFVQIHVHHSYSFSSNASRSASQVAAGIVTEIRNRADPLLTWLSWSSCVTSLFLLLIIFRAKYYQHMFETRSRFDNRYVTKELRDMDFKRLVQGRETVLPLNKREKDKYIQTTSFRLVASEKVHLSRSAVFMVITTYKLMIHMIADYSLYWVLMTIRFHGRFQAPFQANPPDANLKISGSGFLSRFVRSLFNTLGIPLYRNPVSSPVLCLPDPHPPDLQRYGQIGILIILLWFFALFEPYGLRLRHIIMGLYRPERAKARAVWLYNHIQRTRAGFMKFARRKLHREYKYSTEEKYTFRHWLNSHLPFKWLQYLLGTCPEEPHCLLCGTIEYPNDSCTVLVRCETPNCPGTYCNRCFSDIGKLCTICMSPVDYGDSSDVSLEKGSSDESSDSDNDSGNNPGLARDLEAGGRHKTQMKFINEQLECKAKRKGRRNMFFGTTKGARDEIPLLRHTDKVDDERDTNANHGFFLKKAMMIRHNRYCDIVSKQLTRSNETDCFCLYCKIHDISIKSKVTNTTNGAYENETRDTDNIGETGSRNKQFKFKEAIRKPIQKSKSSEANLTTTILKGLKNLRKYSSEKKRQRKKIFKNKMSSKKIMIDLKKRSPYQRKRRKKRKNIYKKRSRTSISFSWSRESNQWLSLSSNSFKKIRSPRSLNLSRQSTNKVKKKVKNCSSKIKINSNIIRFLKSFRKRNADEVFSGGDCAKASKHSEEAKQNISSHINSCSGDYNPTVTNIAKDKLDEINEGTKEKGQEKKKEKIEINIIVERKKLRQCIGNLCRKYSNCWSTAKVKFSPSIKIINYFKTDDAPLKCNNNNHKRRKKSESHEGVPKPNQPTYTTYTCKHQRDNEATRKYRLSSFLSEQEWRKKQKLPVKLQVTDALPLGQYDSELRNQEIKEKKQTIVFNKKGKQKMELQGPKRLENPKCDPTSNKKSPRKQANLRKGDLGNGSSVPCFRELVTIVSSNTNLHSISDQCKCPELESKSPNYGLTRSWNYYRSLGHCDVEDPGYKLTDGAYKGNKERKIVDTVNIPTIVSNKTPYQERQKNVASHSKSSPGDSSIIEVTFTDMNDHFKAKPRQYNKEDFKAKADMYKTRKHVLKKQQIIIKEPSFFTLNKPKRLMKSVLHRLADTFQRISNSVNVEEPLPTQVDKSVTAFPVVRTCACQYYNRIQSYEDRYTQILNKLNASQSVSHEFIADASVNAIQDSCTCATQFISLSKDVSTFYKDTRRKPALKNTGVLAKSLQSIKPKSVANVATMYKNCKKAPKTRNFSMQSGLAKNPSFAEALKAKCASIMFPPPNEKKPKKKKEKPAKDEEEDHPYSKATEMRPVTEEKGFSINNSPSVERTDRDEKCFVKHSVDEKLHDDDDTSNSGIKHTPIVHKNLNGGGSSLAIKIREDSITSIISETLSSIRSEDETKTDTTICSLATIDYVDEKPRNKNRFKVSVIKKANQSTITDRKKFCDVSTVTSDWWSPILERRNKNIALEKKEGGHVMFTKTVRRGDRRWKKSRGVSTEGRMVTFKSHAQIIPTVIDDILSPSRYLLESQKYYNELFSSKFYAPHVLPVNEIQRGEQEMKLSPKSYHQMRRGHKSKRLEKNLTPRKLSSPRRLNVAQLAHIWKVETANQMRQPKHRSGVKTKKNMKKSYDKAAYALKKAEQNLLPRGFVSNDHISMDCHCCSTGTVGSY